MDKWNMATRDEEHVILQQFLRFGETKAIAQEIILQDTRDKQDAYSKQTSRADSEIKKFIERSNLSIQNLMKLQQQDPAKLFAAAGRGLPTFMPTAAAAKFLASPISLTPSPFSPSRDNVTRPLSLTTSPVASSTPMAATAANPLNRLQAYEFRRELASSGASPAPTAAADKTNAALAAAVAAAASGITSNNAMTLPTVVSTLAQQAQQMQQAQRSPVLPDAGVPRALNTTPSSVSAGPSPCVTPHKVPPGSQSTSSVQDGGEMSGGYSGESDDESMGAIDYSCRDSEARDTVDGGRFENN